MTEQQHGAAACQPSMLFAADAASDAVAAADNDDDGADTGNFASQYRNFDR